MSEISVNVIQSVEEIPDEDWAQLDACDNPFVGKAFLCALERGGCLTAQTGWLPRYLAAKTSEGRTVAFVPLFVKTHSYGEYFFDQAWAYPMERDGLQYYPKLTIGIPFTPATGSRVWMVPDVDQETLGPELMKASLLVAEQIQASSVHWLFCTEEEQRWLASVGFVPRHGIQFHWINNGYSSFESMLCCMRQKRRKEIRRERRKAQDHGLKICIKEGPALTERDWQSLYLFYRHTTSTHRAIPYLSESFFRAAHHATIENVVCSLAYDGDEPVAGTLNFRRGPHLYGRYWGCIGDYDCLHFELSYYVLLEWCIEQGIQRFEAGAQGHHKLTRGFMPTLTRAGVYLFHDGYQSALRGFLAEESADTRERIKSLLGHSPFVSSEERR